MQAQDEYGLALIAAILNKPAWVILVVARDCDIPLHYCYMIMMLYRSLSWSHHQIHINSAHFNIPASFSFLSTTRSTIASMALLVAPPSRWAVICFWNKSAIITPRLYSLSRNWPPKVLKASPLPISPSNPPPHSPSPQPLSSPSQSSLVYTPLA